MTMWMAGTNRSGLLKHLAGGRQGSIANAHPVPPIYPVSPDKGEIVMLWGTQPSDEPAESLPHVIVVPEGEIRSFLAWSSTYLDAFRPLTSLCRVVDDASFA